MPPTIDRLQTLQALRRFNPAARLSADDEALLTASEQLPPAQQAQVFGQVAQEPAAQQGFADMAQQALEAQQPTPQQTFLEQAGPQTADAGDVSGLTSPVFSPAARGAADALVETVPEIPGMALDALTAVPRAALEGAGILAAGDDDDTIARAYIGDARAFDPADATPLEFDSSGRAMQRGLTTAPDGDTNQTPGFQGGQGTASALEQDQTTGQVILSIPGVEAPIVTPPGLASSSDEAINAWIRAAQAEGRQRQGVTGGGDVALNTNQASRIHNAINAWRQGQLGEIAAQPRQGSGEARVEGSIRVDERTPGDVDPATQLALANATGMRAAQQGLVDRGAVGLAASHASAGQIAAQEQLAAAQEQRQEAEARQADLMERLSGLQSRIDDVSSRRVDPEAVFGGFGGRIGAAIAVSLGELARATTGGDTNTALGIINAAIDRNIRAQEGSIANERTGVSSSMNALGQMRSVMQDNDAARAGARAMHLAAVESRLEGQLNGLTGLQRQRGEQLLRSIQQERALAAQVSAQMAQGSVTRRSYSARGPASTINAALSRAAFPQAAPGGPQTAQTPQRPRATGGAPRRPQGAPEGQQPAFSGSFDMQANPSGEALEANQAADAERAAETEATGRAVQERLRAVARGGGSDLTSEGTALREEATRAERPANGFILDPDNADALDDFQSGRGEGSVGGQRDYASLAASRSFLDQVYDIIIATQERFGGELLNAEDDVAFSRSAVQQMRMQFIHDMSGTAASDNERAEIAALIPEPGATSDYFDYIQSFERRFTAFYRGRVRTIDSQLRNRFGIVPDNERSQQSATSVRSLRNSRGRFLTQMRSQRR